MKPGALLYTDNPGIDIDKGHPPFCSAGSPTAAPPLREVKPEGG